MNPVKETPSRLFIRDGASGLYIVCLTLMFVFLCKEVGVGIIYTVSPATGGRAGGQWRVVLKAMGIGISTRIIGTSGHRIPGTNQTRPSGNSADLTTEDPCTEMTIPTSL